MVIVSIIIPAYNRSKFIGSTLDSVIDQTFKDWECIVINDGSTDNTEETINGFIKRDPRLRYFYQSNMGPSGARNSGIKVSQGRYILFLDSDDTIEPYMLEKMVKYLEDHPSMDIVSGAWDLIDNKGNRISKKFGPIKSKKYLEDLTFKNLFPVHALLMRKTVIDVCGFFDTNLQALEDWDLWLRAADCGFNFGYIGDLTAHYRQHSDSLTMDIDRLYDNTFKVLDKFFSSKSSDGILKIKPYAYIFQLLNLAKLYNKANKTDKVKYCLERAADIYDKAKFIRNCSILFDRILRDLPFSSQFRSMIYTSSPLTGKLEIRSNHYNKKAADDISKNRYAGTVLNILISWLLWPPGIVKIVKTGLKMI